MRVAVAAEWRDPDIDRHLQRVSTHAARLAVLAGLPPADVELLRLASQLHDIGKVDIPDAVALKPRLLTEEERLIMQGHTETGFKMLEGSDSPLLRLGSVIALSHHERYDGTGYPHGLVGGAIPLEGRIVAIADVFDALRSRRPYKQAYSKKESLEILRSRRRTQLDPELLDLFITDLETRPGRRHARAPDRLLRVVRAGRRLVLERRDLPGPPAGVGGAAPFGLPDMRGRHRGAGQRPHLLLAVPAGALPQLPIAHLGALSPH